MSEIEDLRRENERLAKKCALQSAKIASAVDLIERYSNDEHRAWVLDQIARSLLGSDYEGWRAEIPEYESGWAP